MSILCPNCPQCGQAPEMFMHGMGQAFCLNDGCTTFSWNPILSLDENLMGVNFIDLSGLDLTKE